MSEVQDEDVKRVAAVCRIWEDDTISPFMKRIAIVNQISAFVPAAVRLFRALFDEDGRLKKDCNDRQ